MLKFTLYYHVKFIFTCEKSFSMMFRIKACAVSASYYIYLKKPIYIIPLYIIYIEENIILKCIDVIVYRYFRYAVSKIITLLVGENLWKSFKQFYLYALSNVNPSHILYF